MKRIVLFIAFSLVGAFVVSAQNEFVVQGTVQDKATGAFLEGATVHIMNTTKGVCTDEKGSFEIRHNKQFDELVVSYIGYRTIMVKVNGKRLQIELEPTALDMDEVMVTGSKVDIAMRQVPFTVNVISNTLVEESSEASAILPIVSEHTPGLFVTERSVTGFGVSTNAAGRISIRGVSGSYDPYGTPNSNVLVLVDGVPNYVGIFGHPISDSYVASDVEKVEVIRGPASSLYGSGAMGGVINIITKKQKSDGYELNGRVSYGSFNTQKYMANAGIKKGKFSSYLAVNYDHSDGHRGDKDSSGFDILNSYLKLGYEISDHIQASLDASIADFTADDPGPESAPAYFGVDILRGRLGLSVKNQYKKVKGGLQAYYNYGDHVLSDGWKSTDEVKGLTFYQGLNLFKGNTITLGIDHKNYGGKGNSGMAANEWKSVYETGAYALFQQELKSFTFNAGMRLENNELFGAEWVPCTGLSYELNASTNFKISAAKGFRNPLIMELYLFAPNPDLKPEEMWNYEAGISKLLLDDHLSLNANVFYSQGENMIVKTTPPPFPPSRTNSGEFTHSGAELMMKYLLNSHFSFNLNYSYLDTRTPSLYAPKHQLYFGTRAKYGKLRSSLSMQFVDGLYTSIESDPSFWGDGTAESVESYFLLNAKVFYKVSDFLEVFVSGENLLNQEYEMLYDYPMPGVTLIAGLNLHMNKEFKK